MSRFSRKFPIGSLTWAGVAYATVGALLFGALVLLGTSVVSASGAAMFSLAAFFVGWVAAFNMLFPYAESRVTYEPSTAACSDKRSKHHFVAIDLSRCEQIVGWAGVGIGTAAAAAFVVLLYL